MIKKSNIFTPGNSRKVNPDWFTSKVSMKDISSIIKSKEQNIYHVNFKKGSKTKLHQHDGSQVLIATEGIGFLETYSNSSGKTKFRIKKTQRITLKPGDVTYIPAKTIHAHGSANGKDFTHIAINILAKSKKIYSTIWYESDFKKNVTSIIK